ncbi:nucleotide-binding universal stress UspA family protein [Saccharothrix carnea]|uniref:Nucleotide-binding universal stress UspA family protein n=1 Tax=Saccharothrix carnea TaxID=1280637 RepID=A0A2P8IG09_SACCR|nr:universal stress protein [Saccharothrix carnea]PSL57408.1 nucleotide-binding universal stress UspA family protein [Saccharothrix carnea]
MLNGDVVVGVDDTGVSERAARWAARQAAILGCGLVLVHVVRWPPGQPLGLRVPVDTVEDPVAQRTRDAVEGLAERCREATGVAVRTEILPGDPAEVLARVADRAAFVVVGHSDGGGFLRLLSGSTAERLTRTCPWPLVVVRDGIAVDDRAGGSVVAGVDDSAAGARALRFAFEFAARQGGEVVVVHATGAAAMTMQPVETSVHAVPHEDRGAVGIALAECVRRHPGVVGEVVNAVGSPVDALLAASARAALLVVGNHGKGVVRRALLGSVSHQLVDEAPCPVAVLSPETAATDSE